MVAAEMMQTVVVDSATVGALNAQVVMATVLALAAAVLVRARQEQVAMGRADRAVLR